MGSLSGVAWQSKDKLWHFGVQPDCEHDSNEYSEFIYATTRGHLTAESALRSLNMSVSSYWELSYNRANAKDCAEYSEQAKRCNDHEYAKQALAKEAAAWRREARKKLTEKLTANPPKDRQVGHLYFHDKGSGVGYGVTLKAENGWIVASYTTGKKVKTVKVWNIEEKKLGPGKFTGLEVSHPRHYGYGRGW